MKTLVPPLILLLAFLGGCAQVMNSDSGPQIINAQSAQRLHLRDWDLKDLAVAGHQIVIDVDTRITVRFGADGQVMGFAAVNRLTGTYRLSADGRLTWGNAGIVTTRKAGPPELMQKEKAFLSALAKINAAVIAGHTLILQSDDSSVVLTFAEAGY